MEPKGVHGAGNGTQKQIEETDFMKIMEISKIDGICWNARSREWYKETD